jgi:hypothetical protein
MTRFRERLWPSVWIYLALVLVIPASALVFLPINQLVGSVTGVLLYLAFAGLLTVTAPVVTVSDDRVTAGRATLPIAVIGDVTAFRGAEATSQRGQQLDARAWLVIRGWIDPVVKLEVADESDPTPYWIVSTRRPAELSSAIEAARSATGPAGD